ncbi:endoplasmic reticulum resident protein 27 [Scleropages formosus]|uniref:endoplasmic reticulum resident protein 27 n=1 Tax=Scleropages formosus TaxID=113540 RepID=UPI0008789556|nr:endoplasmic reticulum resident protein 27 [Scleropages formosus]
MSPSGQTLHLILGSWWPAVNDSAITRLSDVSAAEAFIDSSEVVIIGFFESEDSVGYKEFAVAVSDVKDIPVALCGEREVWSIYNISSDTISIFRKADLHQENLQLSDVKKLDSDGLKRFFSINELRYITEYNAVTAVGLFNSEVKTHLLLLANRGSKNFSELKDKMRALAPEFTGKFLFVLVDGAVKSNERALGYFDLKPNDLPRVGIYDVGLDRSWLLPPGKITTVRVREFCNSFLQGELQSSLPPPAPTSLPSSCEVYTV